MSDAPQGPGWYQASDGKWYAPAGWYQASDGRWYPPQSSSQGLPPGYAPMATPPTKRGRGCLKAALVVGGLVVLFIIIVFVVLASNAKKISKFANNGTLGGNPPAAQYKVGDTAPTAGLEATVYGMKDPQPPVNGASQPAPGNHYISVDLQISNKGNTSKGFIDLLFVHLLAQNTRYSESMTAGITPSAPTGQLGPGESARGLVVFEVPDGTTGLKLRVQGSLTAAGAVFTLTKP